MDFDIKSIGLGILLSIAVGGGLYGMYVKFWTGTISDQIYGYQEIGQCSNLLSSSNADEIKNFLNSLPSKLQKLEKSDAAMTGMATLADGKLHLSGMGMPLKQCAQLLNERFEKLK
ncbi:hypothetical protein [Thiomicrorhabdus sp.]|uniref:hypothetical protein n=1 Tax=Thiomicrorhabdus sp. TaxID=2039724 RepID=UPI0029C77878|nr:hypothetical protein [Thiomicrorhabdus sp.]